MDPILLLAQLILMAVGLNAIAAAQPSLFDDHLLRLGLGLFATLFAALVPLRLPLRWARPVAGSLLVLALLTLIFGHDARPGHDYARRWISLGGFNLQPSDFLKLGLVLYMARFFEDKGQDTRILGLVGMVGVGAALVAMEPDLATAGFLLLFATALMLVIGVPLRRLLAVAVASAFLAMALYGPYASHFHHVEKRLAGYRPAAQTLTQAIRPQGARLNQQQLAIRALLRGGLFGQGPGGRMPRVPYAYNDMVFAAVGYALGFLGLVLVFFSYSLIFARALQAAAALEGARSILAAGLALLILLQAAVHIAVVLGLLPPTGIPLPLVSYGGSAMLTFGLAMGMLHRATREAGLSRPRKEAA